MDAMRSAAFTIDRGTFLHTGTCSAEWLLQEISTKVGGLLEGDRVSSMPLSFTAVSTCNVFWEYPNTVGIKFLVQKPLERRCWLILVASQQLWSSRCDMLIGESVKSFERKFPVPPQLAGDLHVHVRCISANVPLDALAPEVHEGRAVWALTSVLVQELRKSLQNASQTVVDSDDIQIPWKGRLLPCYFRIKSSQEAGLQVLVVIAKTKMPPGTLTFTLVAAEKTVTKTVELPKVSTLTVPLTSLNTCVAMSFVISEWTDDT